MCYSKYCCYYKYFKFQHVDIKNIIHTIVDSGDSCKTLHSIHLLKILILTNIRQSFFYDFLDQNLILV